MVRFLAVLLVLLAVPASAQDSWLAFRFIESEDAFTDHRRVMVASMTSAPVMAPGVVLVCSEAMEGVVLSGDEFLPSLHSNVRVRYRFDDGEPMTIYLPPHEAVRVHITDPAHVAVFREGFVQAGRLRYQLGDSRVYDVPLTGSTRAMEQYIAACSEIR